MRCNLQFALMLLFLLCLPGRTQGAYSVGVGAYTEMANHLQSSETETNGFIDPVPAIFVGTTFEIGSTKFMPEILYSRLAKEAEHTATLVALNADLAYELSPNLYVRIGPGIMFRTISGKGGTLTFRNGSSGTMTAYAPDRSQSSITVSANLGLEFIPNNGKLSLRAEAFFLGLLGGAARQWNNILSAAYRF